MLVEKLEQLLCGKLSLFVTNCASSGLPIFRLVASELHQFLRVEGYQVRSFANSMTSLDTSRVVLHKLIKKRLYRC
jgi:hypothetical protein